MSTLSANTLFHFTRDKDTLLNILKTKFFPRICQEEMVIFNGLGKIGYPMVCFCDIPLSQIGNHANTYGKYAVGLKKIWAIKHGITPILYTHSNSLVCNHFRENLNKILSTPERTELLDELYISFFMKPYSGIQLINGKKKKVTFYNEREWRYILPKKDLIIRESGDDEDHIGVYIEDFYKGKSPELAQSLISNLNSRNEQFGLTFTPNDINYIIVKKESEILEVIDAIQRIKGKYSYDDVRLLSTRIISMERIAEDF